MPSAATGLSSRSATAPQSTPGARYWDGLGARHVRVLPAGSRPRTPPVEDGVVVIETADTVVSLWREASATRAGAITLLVRPDKYVAAVISPGDEDRVIAALQTYEAPLVISREEEE